MLFRSDMGYFDEDHYLFIADRKKDMIISGGENIYSREVEETLLLHPAVAEAAVIGVPDPRTVERVCAVVVTTPDTDLTLADVVAYCKGVGMTPFKIPERLEVVDAIPRNGMGKILKVDLRARFG